MPQCLRNAFFLFNYVVFKDKLQKSDLSKHASADLMLIWYKAAGAAFHILCPSLNGMSCSKVFQVHQKRPQGSSSNSSNGVLYKAKIRITSMFFALQKSTIGSIGCFQK